MKLYFLFIAMGYI